MTVFGLLFKPLSWLRRRPVQTDYEEVLESLQTDIDHVQTNLVHIRARKRRASLIFPFWAAVVWLVWTASCWYLGLLGQKGFQEHVWFVWGPVLGAPLLIFFTRRIIRWWYKRVQALEEEHLKDLRKQRQAKIEEIKRATKYDHLRLLLEKYDEDSKPSKGQQRPSQQQQPPGQKQPGFPQTPVKGKVPNGNGSIPPVPQLPPNMRPAGQSQNAQALPSGMRGAQPGQPAAFAGRQLVQPLQRTWVDRVADKVLGTDPAAASLGPEQKYALICTACKKHNGLAAKEEFEEIQYVCPHCGTFNSRRPSSVPTSSPWRKAEALPATEQHLRPGSALSNRTASPANRSLFSRGADASDSPPPAVPLGSHTDDEDDSKESQQLIPEANGASKGARAGRGADLTQRRPGVGGDSSDTN